jgi:hypothetical protein
MAIKVKTKNNYKILVATLAEKEPLLRPAHRFRWRFGWKV